MKRILMLAALLSVSGLSNALAADVSQETRATIERNERAYIDAVLDRDQAALDRLIADDYEYAGLRKLSKTEQIEMYVGSIPPKSETIEEIEVRLFGDTAVSTGLSTAEWLSPRRAGTSSTRWMNVWVREEGGWKIVYRHATVISDDGC